MIVAVAARSAPPDGATHVCRECGGVFTFAGMAKEGSRGGQRRAGTRCLRCMRARKREQERRLVAAPRGLDGTLVEAVSLPDPWPATLLAELLRADRTGGGADFESAWAERVPLVLSRLTDNRERTSWWEALTATRAAWAAAWADAAGPGSGLCSAG
jgi:hypothetical protein